MILGDSMTARGEEPNRGAAQRTGVGLPLLLYAAASLAMIGPHILPPTSISTLSYVPDDAFVSMWDFWWAKQCLLELKNPYWTDLLFHPSGTSLAFHNNPLIYSLLSLPIQLLVPGVRGLAVALNAAIFLSFVLSGFGAYRLAAHVTRSRPSASVAGLVFAFFPFHVLNMINVHLLAIELLPFYVLSLLKLGEAPTARRAMSVAVWLALCFYTSLEYTLYLAIFSLLWLAWQLPSSPRAAARRLLARLAVAGGAFTLLAAPLLIQQWTVARTTPATIGRSLEEVTGNAPALLSLVTPSRLHPVYGRALAFAGEFGDRSTDTLGMRSEASLGLASLALALLGLLGLRREGRAFWAVAAASFLCLSLGPYLRITGRWLTGIPLPYLVLYEVLPPLRGSRDSTRFLPVAMLMLSVLAAFGVRELVGHARRSWLRGLCAASLAALVLFEDLPRRAGRFEPDVDPVYRRIADEPGEFAIVDLAPDPLRLLPQTVHRRPITYLAVSIPRSPSALKLLRLEYHFDHPGPLLARDPAERSAVLERLRGDVLRHAIRYVIFPRGQLEEPRRRLARLLGAELSTTNRLVVCRFGPQRT